MKPETEKALRAASTELRQEILSLLADLMTAEDFVAPFTDLDDELTVCGLEILDAFREIADDDEPEISLGQIDRLHEAICDGRKQDAVDILSDISGRREWSVDEYANLFPGRVTL